MLGVQKDSYDKASPDELTLCAYIREFRVSNLIKLVAFTIAAFTSTCTGLSTS